MKRKILGTALALILVFALVSCDGGLTGIMKMMGKNMLGSDESQVTAAVDSVKVSEENKTTSTPETNKKIGEGESAVTITKGNTLKYKDSNGEGKDLFTVGETKDGTKVIAVDGFALTLDKDVKADVANIEAVLPPQDLTGVVKTLEGSGKDALLTELSKPISDDATKKAAEGTATLVQALMETTTSSLGDDVDEDLKNVVENVTTNLEKNDKELTMGDVVVLQALTNILTTSGSAVLETVDKASSSDSSDTSTKDVINEVYDDAMNTVTIINNVSESTSVFKGLDLTTIVNKFMK